MGLVTVEGLVRRLVRRSRSSEHVEGVLVELDARTLVFVPLAAGVAVPQVGELIRASTTLHHLRQAFRREKAERTANAVRSSE